MWTYNFNFSYDTLNLLYNNCIMTDFRYSAYDIHNCVIQAETSVLKHKNAPHLGDRYCIVLYNKNLNYVGSQACTRSNNILNSPKVATHFLPVQDNDTVHTNRLNFVHQLKKTRFLQDRGTVGKPHSKYGDNYGYFISFGITATRKRRADRVTRKADNANNAKYSLLYQLFQQYINTLHPNIFGENGMYHACIIAKNSMCEWHTDTHNIGHAALTCVGDYVDGAFLIEDT